MGPRLDTWSAEAARLTAEALPKPAHRKSESTAGAPARSQRSKAKVKTSLFTQAAQMWQWRLKAAGSSLKPFSSPRKPKRGRCAGEAKMSSTELVGCLAKSIFEKAKPAQGKAHRWQLLRTIVSSVNRVNQQSHSKAAWRKQSRAGRLKAMRSLEKAR